MSAKSYEVTKLQQAKLKDQFCAMCHQPFLVGQNVITRGQPHHKRWFHVGCYDKLFLDVKEGRRTLSGITEYPRFDIIYDAIITSPGWPYAEPHDWEGYFRREHYRKRDRALAALLYVGALRVSESIRLVKTQFEIMEDHVHIKTIRLSKRKPGKATYRDARLPLSGNRAKFTELIMTYVETLEPNERLFPWSLREKSYIVKEHPYKTKDGTVKDRRSVQLMGTHRAWRIMNAMLPEYTEHWLRAFGEDYLYDAFDHDILAVASQVQVDPRTISAYIRRRHEKYRAA